jgi:hypothetical protein
MEEKVNACIILNRQSWWEESSLETDARWEGNVKVDIKEKDCEGPEQRPLKFSCQRSNEPSVSIKYGEFLD